MPTRKVPDIPDEYPAPSETPLESPGRLPEIVPVAPEPGIKIPDEAPEPEIPDEQPLLPPFQPEIK